MKHLIPLIKEIETKMKNDDYKIICDAMSEIQKMISTNNDRKLSDILNLLIIDNEKEFVSNLTGSRSVGNLTSSMPGYVSISNDNGPKSTGIKSNKSETFIPGMI